MAAFSEPQGFDAAIRRRFQFPMGGGTPRTPDSPVYFDDNMTGGMKSLPSSPPIQGPGVPPPMPIYPDHDVSVGPKGQFPPPPEGPIVGGGSRVPQAGSPVGVFPGEAPTGPILGGGSRIPAGPISNDPFEGRAPSMVAASSPLTRTPGAFSNLSGGNGLSAIMRRASPSSGSSFLSAIRRRQGNRGGIAGNPFGS